MKSGNNNTSGLYVCPMHPEIQSETPGNCPKCGMKLERTVMNKESQKTTYYCKVHSDYESQKKGKCPTCGKKLKKKQEFTYQ
jgi:Cu+-exporting ATPase